eukprot:CAMPEP_0198303732 /NCGR_PEP_ID=MMETSP1449-20131203/57041_1 /TAXON_ID=420275 /ORGANISM="Attheya septentrionalis, Strain CCMP2084" /LENGTH=451 /DNA_ID=CAMNT_0044006239 /DNA_START=39 /DNA_END=1394 /DNA_ORIENTATION=-
MEEDANANANGRRVRRKRWAACLSARQGILKHLLTLPGLLALLMTAGAGFIGYQAGQTRSDMEQLPSKSTSHIISTTNNNHNNVGVGSTSNTGNLPEGVKKRQTLQEKLRNRVSRIPEAMNKTKSAAQQNAKTARHEPLPEHVENLENVGWLLPGIAKAFYLGTGAGESFGPPLTLPTPILVVGMPKTGTTSIRDFFRCNGHNASHWKCATDTMTMGGPDSLRKKAIKGKYCAQVIKDNIANNRPALQDTGNYQVYAQMDVELPEVAVMQGVLPFACYMPQVNDLEKLSASYPKATFILNTRIYAQMDVELPHETVFEGIMRPFACYMPQVNDLEQLSASYPKATFILNTRNASRWVNSLRTFLDFDEKLKQCDLKGFPAGTGDTNEEFEAFFHEHAQNIRNFVKNHPSHTLIEVNIEDPNAGTQLAEAFGQNAKCWVKRNAGAARTVSPR